MGGAKDHWMNVEARGYDDMGQESCFTCLGDGPGPAMVQEMETSKGTCEYCGTEGPVFQVEDLVELLLGRIRMEWEDLYEASLPRDDESGQPMLNRYECSTSEVLYEEGFDSPCQRLIDDLCEGIHTETWCERDPIDLSESDALRFTWDSFCDAVRTRYRFTFFRIPDRHAEFGGDDLSRAGLLDRLKEIVEEVGPWSTFGPEDLFLRARLETGWRTGKDLGTSPAKFAKANRMSPDGIGMFYGAFDEQTCINEIVRTLPGSEHKCTVGTFKSKTAMTLLDLTLLHPGSVFEEPDRTKRQIGRFLNHFKRSISAPANVAMNSAVEYAPTQILTEYFRHTMIEKFNRPVDGIVYKSATTSGEKCVVLFVDHEACGEPGDPKAKLELVKAEDKTIVI